MVNMKTKTILILAVLLVLGWAIYSRFDCETLPEKGKEIQMIDEIVLGSIPATEENIPTGVFPVENRIVEQFSKDELVTVSHVEEPASDFAEAFIQIQFEGYDTCLPLSDGITYDVSEGESLNLEIVRCIWTPVDNLMYIGVYNLKTETG